MKTKYLAVSFIIICICLSTSIFSQERRLWGVGGQNLHNTRNAADEDIINPQNVGSLRVKWIFTTHGDVSATPTVDRDAVYFPDWGGYINKVNARTGALIWSHPMSFYTGVEGDFARASIAIEGNRLIVGTQANSDIPATLDGAHVIAVNKNTGQLLWKTKMDDFIGATITQSAVVYRNKIYVGVASNEEGLANDSAYQCCAFRGSVVALDLYTGRIIWKTYMLPAGKGFTGNAVWGSTPVVDVKRKSLYVTTGNNYTVPQAVLDCVNAGGTPDQVKNCIAAVDGSSTNYFDGVVSLDLKTGRVKWYTPVLPFDAWNVACLFEGPNCPDTAGPDYDFGQGPALFTVGHGRHKRELLGAGQKSGIYWTFNPDNGQIVWSTQVGPGATLGGLQWGSAVDENRIYTAVSNSDFKPFTLTTGPGAGQTISGGFWAALNPRTGERIWEVAADKPPLSPYPAGAIAPNQGMVSVANGVVFAGAMDSLGTMYAFNGATGQKLWSFESGGSVNSGAAIVKGTVYWGSGYENIDGTPNNKLYAFEICRRDNDKPAVSSLQNKMAVLPAEDARWALVSPNPFGKGNINLYIYDNAGKVVSWELVNLQGKLLQSGKFTAASNAHIQPLGLNNLTPGSYYIRVLSGTRTITLSVVKAG